MALSINTNVASLNAQKNLGKSQAALQKSMQRLSTGMRINSAKDDAAGLAISDRMTSQIRGMNQAVRNSNDGISLAQTAEGGLGEMTNIAQRMRELAVQSRNATNSDSDRQSLNDEFGALKAEMDRIVTTTSFNGKNVLDGSIGSAEFQVGANVGETITMDLSTDMSGSNIGKYASEQFALAGNASADSADSYALAAGDLKVNNISIGAVSSDANSAKDLAAAINSKTDEHGVTASAGVTTKEVSYSSLSFTDGVGDNTLTYELNINGTNVISAGESDSVLTAEELSSRINDYSDSTGVVSAVSDGKLTLTASDGSDIEIEEKMAGGTDGASDTVTGYFGASLDMSAADKESLNTVAKAGLTLESSSQIDLTFASDADVLFGKADTTASATVSAQGIAASDILSADNADEAIARLDQALNDIDTFRGNMGAMQNRFESTIANLQNVSENLSAARSRVLDADIAQETSNMTKQNILQQAGVSILAQANQAPQMALSLIG